MEQLTRAQDSSDLGESHEGLGDVDWVRAAGMVGQRHALALDLWRVTELGDGRSLGRVVDGMLLLCRAMGHTSDPYHTVSRVLMWLLRPRCETCCGRGHPVIPGTPTLSDVDCEACAGTGERNPQWGEHERALYERVKQVQAVAAGALARKLRD